MALERTDEEVEHALDLGEFALYMRDGTVPVRVVVAMSALKQRGEIDTPGHLLTPAELVDYYRPIVEALATDAYEAGKAYAEADGMKTVRVREEALCAKRS